MTSIGSIPGFWTPLVVEKAGERTWRLVQDLVYATAVEGAPPSILVPAGFETDFASVPRGLWNLLPPDGLYTAPAVVHDFLYREAVASRAAADSVFEEAMQVVGTGAVTRRILWAFVRLGGWMHYGKV